MTEEATTAVLSDETDGDVVAFGFVGPMRSWYAGNAVPMTLGKAKEQGGPLGQTDASLVAGTYGSVVGQVAPEAQVGGPPSLGHRGHG